MSGNQQLQLRQLCALQQPQLAFPGSVTCDQYITIFRLEQDAYAAFIAHFHGFRRKKLYRSISKYPVYIFLYPENTLRGSNYVGCGDLIRARTMEAFFPLIAIAIIYFAVCRLMAWALGRLAKRLEPKEGPRTIKGVEL